jgi:hypothetical protein
VITPLPTLHQRWVPTYGRIAGGVLDGWEFTLLHAGVDGGRAFLSVQAHAPGWPFPLATAPTRLFDADFTALQADRKTPQRDTQTMIKAAMAADGAPA